MAKVHWYELRSGGCPTSGAVVSSSGRSTSAVADVRHHWLQWWLFVIRSCSGGCSISAAAVAAMLAAVAIICRVGGFPTPAADSDSRPAAVDIGKLLMIKYDVECVVVAVAVAHTGEILAAAAV